MNIKRILNFLCLPIDWWDGIGLYVILDPSDNSVTLSEYLFEHMRRHAVKGEEAVVCMSRTSDTLRFAFIEGVPDGVTATKEQIRLLCPPIQYNEKTRTVGFSPNFPTVTAMLNDWNAPHDKCLACSIRIRRLPSHRCLYEIIPPKHVNS